MRRAANHLCWGLPIMRVVAITGLGSRRGVRGVRVMWRAANHSRGGVPIMRVTAMTGLGVRPGVWGVRYVVAYDRGACVAGTTGDD